MIPKQHPDGVVESVCTMTEEQSLDAAPSLSSSRTYLTDRHWLHQSHKFSDQPLVSLTLHMGYMWWKEKQTAPKGV